MEAVAVKKVPAESECEPKRLSLIIFAQRVSSGLRQLLFSIDEQKYPHLELILVLPIERNFLREWIAKLSLKHKVSWHQLHTENIAEAYNRASFQAKGEYLLFLNDQDRLLGAYALQRVVQSIDSQGDVIASAARILRLRDARTSLIDPSIYQQRYKRAYSPFFLSATLIKTDFFRDLGGFNSKMGRYFFGLEFWQRALQKNAKITLLEGVLVESVHQEELDSSRKLFRGSCFLSITALVFKKQGALAAMWLLLRTVRFGVRFLLFGPQEERFF